ncbi:MAG: glycosyltransferase [Cyanobacteria bacterium P01_G01_bin.38]
MQANPIRLLFLAATEQHLESLMSGDLSLPAELAHSVETLTLLSFEFQEVGVLGCTSEKAYNEVLGAGFRVIGSGYMPPLNPNAILKLVVDFCPTHIVLQVPDRAVLSWAIRNQIEVIALFNNHTMSFPLDPNWDMTRIASLLNHPLVCWVAGQGLKGSEALQQAGVEPQKIIPWVWPHLMESQVQQSKQLDIAEQPLRLLYAGPIVSTKGVGDLLIAMVQLRSRGLNATLKLIGTGETDRFRTQVEKLSLVGSIEFLETVPEQGFKDLFDQTDILVIPSRHEYPENNLNLIDAGLSAHVPIVASDHPLFAGRLYHGVNAMIFPAGNSRALAHRIERLTSQPQLYQQLSASSQLSHAHIQQLVPWADVIEHWFEPSDRRGLWLSEHCLTSGRYASLAPEATYFRRSA